MKNFFAHETAIVDDPSNIGEGTKIWHYSHVMKDCRIGKNCVLGQNVNIAGGVIIGNGVKIQNNVSVYTGTELEDFVFLGPSCVLTNVTNPRAEINRHTLYEKTLIRRGASIGANATIVCGITIGRYAFIGAGAVVIHDVPDYAMVVGNPSRKIGWVSRHGIPLKSKNDDGYFVCPESGLKYIEEGEILRCIDIDEDSPLPEELSTGSNFYDSYK